MSARTSPARAGWKLAKVAGGPFGRNDYVRWSPNGRDIRGWFTEDDRKEVRRFALDLLDALAQHYGVSAPRLRLNWQRSSPDSLAYYDPRSKTITVWEMALRAGDFEDTVVHEFMHHVRHEQWRDLEPEKSHNDAFFREVADAVMWARQWTNSHFAKVASIEWRDQIVRVYGRPHRLGDVKGGKFYHGSPVELSPGALLEPGHGKHFDQSADNAVSITSDPDRAAYWVKEMGESGFVYEVEPLGVVDAWRVMPADRGTSFVVFEARVPSARVVDTARTAKVAALVTKEYEGEVGNKDHVTCRQDGTLPTSAIAHLQGVMGEQPGEHRNKQGEAWETFKADIAEHGIKDPIFITVDYGEEPKVSEGNHRRDAAVELGLPEAPVEIRYFGHAEQQSKLGSIGPIKDRVLYRAIPMPRVHLELIDGLVVDHPERATAEELIRGAEEDYGGVGVWWGDERMAHGYAGTWNNEAGGRDKMIMGVQFPQRVIDNAKGADINDPLDADGIVLAKSDRGTLVSLKAWRDGRMQDVPVPGGISVTAARRAQVGDRVQMRRAPVLFENEDDEFDPSLPMGTVLSVTEKKPGLSQGVGARVRWDNGSEGRHSLGMLRVVDEGPAKTSVARPGWKFAKVAAKALMGTYYRGIVLHIDKGADKIVEKFRNHTMTAQEVIEAATNGHRHPWFAHDEHITQGGYGEWYSPDISTARDSYAYYEEDIAQYVDDGYDFGEMGIVLGVEFDLDDDTQEGHYVEEMAVLRPGSPIEVTECWVSWQGHDHWEKLPISGSIRATASLGEYYRGGGIRVRDKSKLADMRDAWDRQDLHELGRIVLSELRGKYGNEVGKWWGDIWAANLYAWSTNLEDWAGEVGVIYVSRLEGVPHGSVGPEWESSHSVRIDRLEMVVPNDTAYAPGVSPRQTVTLPVGSLTMTSAWDPMSHTHGYGLPEGWKFSTGYGDAVPGGYNGRIHALGPDGTAHGYIDYQTESGSDEALIAMIEVDPEYRRKGIGTALLEQAKRDTQITKWEPGVTTADGSAWWRKQSSIGVTADLGTPITAPRLEVGMGVIGASWSNKIVRTVASIERTETSTIILTFTDGFTQRASSATKFFLMEGHTSKVANAGPGPGRTHERMTQEIAENTINHLMRDGGYTINAHKSVPRNGWMVSLPGHEQEFPSVPSVTPTGIQKYIDQHDRVLAQNDHYVGGWVDSTSGKTYLDTSKRIPERDAAIAEGIRNHQLAIYNVGTGEELRLDMTHHAEVLAGSRFYIAPEVGAHEIHRFIRQITPAEITEKNQAIFSTGVPPAGTDLVREFAVTPVGDDFFAGEADDISRAYRDLPILTQTAAPLWKEFGELVVAQAAALARVFNVIRYDDHDPYVTAEQMHRDIDDGIYRVTSLHSHHPGWDVDTNVAFRVAHDILGHGVAGSDFSFAGEVAAYQAECTVTPEHLWPVLFTEIIAQSAYANTHHLFGEQKVGLIPLSQQQIDAAVGKVMDAPDPQYDAIHRSASTYSVYHGTRTEAVAGIRSHGLEQRAQGINPAGWYLVTTSPREAAQYSNGGSVVEFTIPSDQRDDYLWPGVESDGYAHKPGGGGVYHGIRQTIPASMVTSVRSADDILGSPSSHFSASISGLTFQDSDEKGRFAEQAVIEAVLDGKVVGKMEYKSSGRRVKVWEIEVDRDHRRQGIGNALLEELLRRSGASEVEIMTTMTTDGKAWWLAWSRSQGVELRPGSYEEITHGLTPVKKTAAFTQPHIPGMKTQLYRGLQIGWTPIDLVPTNSADLQDVIRGHLDTSKGVGQHWTANWRTAAEFALDKAFLWGGEKEPTLEDDVWVGLVLHGQVPLDAQAPEGSEEWKRNQMGQMLIPGEREVFVGKGAEVTITTVEVGTRDQEDQEDFFEVDVSMEVSAAQTAKTMPGILWVKPADEAGSFFHVMLSNFTKLTLSRAEAEKLSRDPEEAKALLKRWASLPRAGAVKAGWHYAKVASIGG